MADTAGTSANIYQLRFGDLGMRGQEDLHGSLHPLTSNPLCVMAKQSDPRAEENKMPPTQSTLFLSTCFFCSLGMTIAPITMGMRAVPPRTAKQYCHPRLQPGQLLLDFQTTHQHAREHTLRYRPKEHPQSAQVQHLPGTPTPWLQRPSFDLVRP